MNPNQTPSPTRPGRIADVCLPLILVLYAQVSFLPITPSAIRVPPLEWGWMDALADAWVKGRVFGRDIVFTYGPYGFAQGYYLHPGVAWKRLGIMSFMFFLIVALMWRVGRIQGVGRVLLTASILLGLHALVYPDRWDAMAYAILLLGLLHAWSCFEAGRKIEGADSQGTIGPWGKIGIDVGLLLMWSVAVALLMWVKFTIFVVGGPLFLAAASFRFRSNLRVGALAAGVFGLSLVGWWLLAGQPIDAMFEYVWWSANLSSGYADAMVMPIAPMIAASTILGGIILASSILFVTRGSDRLSRIVVGMPSLLLLLLIYRTSMVRHAGYWMGVMLVMMAPYLLLICWRQMDRHAFAPRWKAAWRVAIFLIGVAGYALWSPVCQDSTSVNALGYFIKPFRDFPDRIAALKNLTRLQEVANQDFMARRPDVASILHLAHPERLSADIVELDLRVVIGQKFNYSPRPIFQSYTALSVQNVELNARHLASDKAPDLMFYDSSPIDNRFPTLDEGPSWPILFSRYAPAGVMGDRYLVAARRPRALTIQKGNAVSRKLAFGEWFEIGPMEEAMDAANDVVNDSSTFLRPSGNGPLWCEIDYEGSPMGKCYGLAIQPISAEMEVRLSDGSVERFRLVQALARHGFVLSPVAPDRNTMGTLWTDPMGPGTAGRRVKAIRICSWRENDWAFEPHVGFKLSRLRFLAK